MILAAASLNLSILGIIKWVIDYKKVVEFMLQNSSYLMLTCIKFGIRFKLVDKLESSSQNKSIPSPNPIVLNQEYLINQEKESGKKVKCSSSKLWRGLETPDLSKFNLKRNFISLKKPKMNFSHKSVKKRFDEKTSRNIGLEQSDIKRLAKCNNHQLSADRALINCFADDSSSPK